MKKYLEDDGPAAPPAAAPRRSRRGQVIDAYAHVVDEWLRAELLLKVSVIHERLVAEYGFTGHYQRVKMYLQEARPKIAEELGYTPSELARLHRRFEVVPGAQAQVDWGDEGGILAHVGIPKVYSFHMVLSYSRGAFVCFTISQDLATFWACHRRAFDHFGGVPGSIVYDRTKTVVRRHVAPRKAVPLHPEAVAFAGHYGFDPDVLAAYRPTGKGRVERQVTIIRDHVLAGRSFSSLSDMDKAFLAWVPIRRATTHRTHGRTRTQTINRLHRLLLELFPGGAKKFLSARQARALIATTKPRDISGKTRRRLAVELIGELEGIDKKIKAADKELTQLVIARGSTLMDLHGIGPSGAARLLADVGDIRRFADRGRFASWNGTAPLDASPGAQQRHRLSRAGNRRINRTLHIMAVVQLRKQTKGRAYFDAKKSAGKTPMEAMRALKRRLSNLVYARMIADHKRRRAADPGGHSGTTLQSSVTDLTPDIGSSDKPLPGPATSQPKPVLLAAP